MNTKNGEGPNTSISQAVAPLKRPHGIEIFEKSREFRDPKNQINPKIPKSMKKRSKSKKIRFDRLCQGLNIDLLPFGFDSH